METFSVKKGKRYRFRVISNGLLNCPIRISVEGHRLLMIASDGQPFKPVPVDAFNLVNGER
jgi:FtsP/CotA-like multicopper oxidase with cupredoxin domain